MPNSKRIQVFIDTNVFLSFFAFTDEDIDQLKSVKEKIEAGSLRLHLTRQVVDEFNRNREGKIEEALAGFQKGEFNRSIPRLLASYDDAKKYRRAVQQTLGIKNLLLATAREEASKKELAADKLFAELCEAATIVEPSEAVYARAVERHQRGNPPGKADGPLGDKLNWETLLTSVPKGSDLHIVSKDSDYASPLTDGRPHQFLIDEWRDKKEADLFLHEEIRVCLKQLLQIEFESLTKEKVEAIERLEEAGDFASTHAAVARLLPILDALTVTDAERLARAALDNSQVNWIAQDEDVQGFYSKLLIKHWDAIKQSLRDEVAPLFGLDIPF